jgi:uncharacterized repeat protein (TIGR01451 family)
VREPERKMLKMLIMKNTSTTPVGLRAGIRMAVLVIGLLSITSTGFSQINCTNCNANDFTFQQYFLGDANHNLLSPTCTTGNSQSAYLWMQVTSSSTRYSLWVDYDLMVTDPVTGLYTITHVNECLYENQAIPATYINLGPITWTCGDEVEVLNFVMAWKQQINLACSFDTPKCICVTPTTMVIAPLSVNYTYSVGCNDGVNTPVTFTSATTGGSDPKSYSWDFGDGLTSAETNPIHNYTVPGIYSVVLTVTDGTSSATKTALVNVPGQLLLSGASVTTPIACFGGSATVTIAATGGTPPYVYNFNGEENSTGVFNNVLAGTDLAYTITDAGNCGPIEGTISVTQPTELTLTSATVTSRILCQGGTATVTLVASGGTLPYTYNFDGQSDGSGVFTGVAAGTGLVYSITDGNNCEINGTLDVLEPVVLSVTSATVTSPILCNGGTGTVTIVAAGGTEPYSYTFNGDTNDTGVFSGVLAGNGLEYSITDANECSTVTGTVDLTEPSALALTSATVDTPILCFGGSTSVTIIATGGTAPYSYTFNGETNETGLFTGVLAGNDQEYSITDANDCGPVTGTLDVTEPEVLALGTASVTSPILCFGGAATVTITATGGTAPYSFSFNGETNDTGVFTGVLAGTGLEYSITDGNSCGPVTGSLDVTEPEVLALGSASVTSPILCFGGTATVTLVATGGTLPYAYTFNGETNDTGVFTGVIAGDDQAYSITDANTCTPVTGSVDVTQPAVLALTSAVVDAPILCNGGTTSVTIIATGGTEPYSYTFNGETNNTGIFTGVLAGNDQEFSITDANDCGPVRGDLDISEPAAIELTSAAVTSPILCFGGTATVTIVATGGTAPLSYTFNGETNDTGVFSNISAGNDLEYSITDANQCTPVTGSLDVTQPEVLALGSASVTSPILCNGGTATVTITATGGTLPYAYTFNGVTNDTGVFTGVLAGDDQEYSITDANECTPVTGSVDVTEPAVFALTSATVTSPILCNGGTATVTLVATGGTAPYSYTFNGETNDTGVFTGVLAGDDQEYSITDANDCGPLTGSVDVSEPVALELTSAAVTTPILCFGGTATVTLVATGGTGPISYTFNGITNETGVFSGISAGDGLEYSITDANECTPLTGSLDVTQPEVLALGTASVTTPILCNGGTATVTITATGGTAPYSFTFNGETNDTGVFTGVLAGDDQEYSITDANECTPVTGSLDVTQPAVLALGSASVTTPILCNGGSATVTITATGGTAPYSYTFNGETNDTGIFTGVLAGNDQEYSITDANECTPVTGSVDVVEPSALELTSINADAPILCNGGTTSVTIVATGGTGPYSYTFNGETNETGLFTGVVAGNDQAYSITDANNCGPVTGSIDITQPAVLALGSALVTSPILCNGGTATVTLTATGGTAPYSFTFNGETNDTGVFTGVLAGEGMEYSITDANECTPVTGRVNVTEPLAITFGTPTISNINCNENEGVIVISATGGTGTLTYSISPNIGTQSPAGTFTGLSAQEYTITALDENDCSVETTATVGTNPDDTKPTITCPANISVSAATGQCAANVTITEPTGNDNCSTEITFTGIRADGLALTDPYPVGTTLITWTATDEANNVSDACTQSVTVTDNQNPVIVACAANQAVMADENCQALVPNFTGIEVTDNCTAPSSIEITQSPIAGTSLGAGDHIITVTARDAAGNVASCSVLFTITSAIIANDDEGTLVNGLIGGTSFVNVLNNDVFNCFVPNLDVVNLTFISSSHPNVKLSGTNVIVEPGTPTGTYQLVYQICDKVNTANCDLATVSVPVLTPAPANIIDAVEDAGGANGLIGGVAVPNVLVNDKINNVIVLPSQVTLSFVGTTHPNVTLNGAQVVVAPSTPAGTYFLTYRICEVLNPTNCDQAVVTVTVVMPINISLIDAVPDAGSVNGLLGGTPVPNVLVNDLLNGNPVIPSQVVTTFISTSHPNVTMSGTSVVVAPNTPPGTYYLDYRICEVLNPTNCDQTTVTITIEGLNNDLVITKSSTDTIFSAVGDVLHYNLLVTNSSTTNTYYNINVTDPNAVITSGNPISSLAPGKQASLAAVHTITQADIDAGKVLNYAYVLGKDLNGTPVVTDTSNIVAVNAFQRPQLTITKFVTENTFRAVGDVIHYTFEIFNCGNVTNTNIVVSDPKAVNLQGHLISSLAPRHTVTAFGEYVVTQADVDSAKISNIAFVEGLDPKGQPVRDDSNEVTIYANQPSRLTVALFADESSFSKVGDKINYTIAVKNNRTTIMSDIVVSDSNAIISGGTPIWRLESGRTVLLKATHTVTQSDLDAGKVVNVAYARGKDFYDFIDRATSNEVTVFASQSPLLLLTKKADETSYNAVGDLIHYTNEIKNTGNVRITGITLSDPSTSTIGSNQIDVLNPGETASIRTTHAVSQSDLNLGLVEKTASVSAFDANSQPIHVTSNPVSVPAIQNAQIQTTLTAAETSYSKEGDMIHYSIEVRNMGNVTLTNLNISEATAGNAQASSVPVLVPGSTVVVTVNHMATLADLVAGKVVNTATATAYNPIGEKIIRMSNQLTVVANETEGVIITKTAQESVYNKVGDVVHYIITVRNQGNKALNNLSVSIPDAIITGSPVSPNLGAFETTTLLAVHTINQNDLDAGQLSNVASVTGKYANGTDFTGKSNVVTLYGIQNPQLTTVISSSASAYSAIGEEISYTVEVQNTGNVTITAIDLNSQAKLAFNNYQVMKLAPGKVAKLTATRTVTVHDLDAGKVVSSVNAVGTDPGRQPVVANSNEYTVKGIQNPGLSTVATPLASSFSEVGEVINYNIVVTNSGNVSLISTAVTDPKIVILTARANVILLPGESFDVAASHIVTQEDINAGQIVTAPKAEGFDLNGNTITKVSDKVTVVGIQRAELVVEAKAVKQSFKKVGEVINYSIVVKNIGNVAISNTEVADPNAMVSLDKPISTILPGSSAVVSATHVVSQADLDAGEVVTVAKATGFDLKNNAVTSFGNTVSVSGVQNHELTTVAESSVSTYKREGEVIVYTVKVTNQGNVTMNNISVTDDKNVIDFTSTIPTLAPGETASITTEYRVSIDDINAGKLVTAPVAVCIDPNNLKFSYLGNDVTVRLIIENFNLNNYPNPFMDETTIVFDLTERMDITLKVYDMAGREVGQIDKKEYNEGRNYVIWKSNHAQKGLYVLKLITDGNQATRILSIVN